MIETLNTIIRGRRSVFPKFFTGNPVSDEVIHDMLENARWAPTHKLTEPWKFTVFTGEGIRKLADFQSELYKNLASARGNFEERKYLKLQNNPLLCSHIISLGMQRDPRESVPEVEEIEAVATAVQNMLLTAHAHGAGAYWGSGGITYEDEAKEFFGLGERDKLLGFVFIGEPEERDYRSKRIEIAEKTSWVV